MIENNQIPIVTRTQVFLTDPEFFCNKSWTISFNMNVKSWTSFHSYIPNWYVGENNFFYSGMNNCCSDVDANLTALVGRLDRTITTTTTSTLIPITTTTTTTIFVAECDLIGTAFEVNCDLTGTGYITIPSSTTTTICQRPSYLLSYVLYKGYETDGGPAIITSASLAETCESFAIIASLPSTPLLELTFMSTISINYTNNNGLDVGQILYNTNYLTDCSLVADGWYYDLPFVSAQDTIYHVENGVITEIVYCDCGTTTTTTTTIAIPECCGVVILSTDGMYLLNTENGYTTTLLDTPNFMTANSLAMTNNYLWNINNTQFVQWDITLTPFTAVYNREIDFPVGYVPGQITALNNSVLICVDNINSPTSIDIVEIDVTDTIGVSTFVFSIPDIAVTSNLLYTFEGKLIFANQDLISGDTYISQYDYATTTIELNINLGTTVVTSVFECDCAIFFTDDSNIIYNIRKESPYEITEITTVGIPIISVTQPNSCITSSLSETTTTTTTTP